MNRPPGRPRKKGAPPKTQHAIQMLAVAIPEKNRIAKGFRVNPVFVTTAAMLEFAKLDPAEQLERIHSVQREHAGVTA